MGIFAKKEVIMILSLIGIFFLLGGCSKNANDGVVGKNNGITASVIEDSRENCRFGNDSDCRPIEIRKGETEHEETDKSNETANAVNMNKEAANISEEAELSNCEEGWKCVEARHRAYQYSNCSWTSIEYCVYGCKDGTCNAPPICKLNSLKCDNDNVVKCEDGYEWKMNESCDYLCQDGICISRNETVQTNITANTTLQNDFIADNCMSVTNFNYAPAGNNLSQEYFTLKNSCRYSIDMGSWTAKDNQNHIFTFPSFNLNSATDVSVVTGSGSNNSTTLYWGRSSAVWNNDGDTLYLNTSNGTSVLIYNYP